MIRKCLKLVVPVFLITFIIGCNDSPSDLGSEFVNQDGIEVKKIDSSIDTVSQFSTNFKRVINLGSSDHLLIGKAENVVANTLLKFVFVVPDSIKNEIKNNSISVLDSYIELTKDYRFGDSASVFDYGVYKITSSWSSSTFNADSFATLSFDNFDLSSQRSTTNDTTYSFHLDTTITSMWLKNYADTTIGSNNGILLSPTSNSDKILGFTAFNVSGINDPILRIVINKTGWAERDTLIGVIASDISVVTGQIKNTGPNNLTIQSSLTSEAKLFFDLSVLPSDCVVNSAILTFTIDTIETITGTNFSNSLRASLLSDSSKNEVNNNFSFTLKRNANTFAGDITNMIRAWKNNTENKGMLIRASSEFRGVEIFAIKGSNAVSLSDRPKLEIFYSRKKY